MEALEYTASWWKMDMNVIIKRVVRLMRVMGLKAIQKTTDSNHNLSLKEDLLNRNFDTSKPNKVWVSDITYIPTAEG